MSAYASIPRSYDLAYLRDVRLAKRLFPNPEPVAAPAFPKPGQTIRLVFSSADELPPPAFPKPAQLNRRDEQPRKFARRRELPTRRDSGQKTKGSACSTERKASQDASPQASLAAGAYLKALTDLAENELSRAAIKEDWNTVTRCFSATPVAVLFARSYEQYLADREAVGGDLQRVFRHYTWWLNLKRGEE